MFVFDSNNIRDYYDCKIKIRKNGDIVIRKYDNPIITRKKGYDTALKQVYSINDDPLEKAIFEEKMRENDRKSIERNLDHANDSEQCSKLNEIRKDSLLRSRNLLIDYACENAEKFNTFITLTFKDEVIDINLANKYLNTYLTAVRRDMKKKGKEFYYLGVPEYQKNGRVHTKL